MKNSDVVRLRSESSNAPAKWNLKRKGTREDAEYRAALAAEEQRAGNADAGYHPRP
jgi:hypothetical protein